MRSLPYLIGAAVLIGGIAISSATGDEGPSPGFEGAVGWLNSVPLSGKALRGKVCCSTSGRTRASTAYTHDHAGGGLPAAQSNRRQTQKRQRPGLPSTAAPRVRASSASMRTIGGTALGEFVGILWGPSESLSGWQPARRR